MRTFLIVLLNTLMLGSLASASDWWEKVKVKGDLRYRHEMIDEQDEDARHRHRIRARLGIDGKVNDYTKIGIQFATGSDDPVSTNQTLDDGFSSKNLVLDMAYLEYQPVRVTGLTITAGKFHNPFYKPGSSELLWDSDMNPEGGTANFSRDFDDFKITFIGSGLWIDERSSADDSWLGAGMGILKYNMNEKTTSFTVGAGYFDYVNAKGFTPFFSGEPMGNSPDTVIAGIDGNDTTFAEVYKTDFELLEMFAEVTHHVNKIPLTAMFDYVTNTAADSLETGWLVGFRAGKTKKPWSWAFRYIYREVERDAVVGTFTDSDFRGGGTDAKGHEIGGSLQLAENTTFDVTYFINKIGLDREEADFNRLQVDIQLKF
ncbi:MAG: putative porin [Candidatus Zixiibacteriota bacterium]